MVEAAPEVKEKERPKAKKKTVDKWKKKLWYKIYAPADFEEKELAETVAEKPQMVVGRKVVASAGELSGIPTKSHIYFTFQVSEVKGNKAHTVVLGHHITDSYMRRITRRRSSKIEIVTTLQTKDGKKVRVKTVAVTAKKATRRQEKAVYHALKEEIEKFGKGKDYQNLVSDFVFGNLPAKLFGAVKKIALIKRVEITKSSLLK